MSNHIQKHRSITPETENLLNTQIMMEAQASAAYLAMASWADIRGYANAAKFLYDHAEEERAHMLKIFHYTNEVGGHALAPVTTKVSTNFNDLKNIFDIVLTQEIKVTQAIHQLVDHVLKTKDHMTHHFLQWFVEEQREEEKVARRIIELFDIIGESGIGMYMIDEAIGKIK